MNTLNLRKKIKIELLKLDVSQAEIGRQCGVSRSLVCMVISGVNKSALVRRAICKATGLPMSIWDEIDRDRREA